jgi:hypothetical protein
MPKYILDRRLFLRRSGAAVLATGAGGLAVFRDPAGAWAMTLSHLDTEGAATLLRLARILYPHDQLGDMYYAVVVEALDAEARDDEATRALVDDGLARLDAALGVAFTDLSEGTQTDVVEKMIADPFIQKVRGTTVVHLYNNKLVWRHFGYEGSSAEHGGYLERGFQDLGWLEAPSEEASPAAFYG